MEILAWVFAVVVLILIAAFVREYRQRVKRFRKMEAEYDAMRARVKRELERGGRL